MIDIHWMLSGMQRRKEAVMFYLLLGIGGAASLSLGFLIALGRAAACADARREEAFMLHLHQVKTDAIPPPDYSFTPHASDHPAPLQVYYDE
jgi:hypothetical protein